MPKMSETFRIIETKDDPLDATPPEQRRPMDEGVHGTVIVVYDSSARAKESIIGVFSNEDHAWKAILQMEGLPAETQPNDYDGNLLMDSFEIDKDVDPWEWGEQRKEREEEKP